jgi:hypothetical protein
MRKFLTVGLLLPASVLAMDEIVGEWAVDAESCRESRLIFDIEGNHSAVVAEDGRWESLGVAKLTGSRETCSSSPTARARSASRSSSRSVTGWYSGTRTLRWVT